MGYVVGRVVISFILLPHYFRGDLYTAYELIERRFGRGLRSLTAGLFLLTRTAAEGVRVYAVSIVVAIALGTGEVASIAIITALTLIYTFEGGLAAVIWTDVVQTVIYVGGTLVGLWTILHLVPGGWSAIHAAAASAGKLQVFDFTPSLWIPYTFWAGVIGGTFFITASHGTDQLIVQRLLAARSRKQSVTALLSSGVAILFQFALVSDGGRDAVGVLPRALGDLRETRSNLPHLHRQTDAAWDLGPAHRCDFSGSNVEPQRGAELAVLQRDHGLLSAPSSTSGRAQTHAAFADGHVFFAMVLFGLAVFSLHKAGRVVEVGLQIASVAYGALLGVFLLGVLTETANQRGAMVGMLFGFVRV